MAKQVAIVGYATEGIVSADYFYKLGCVVTICDKNENLTVPQDYTAKLGANYLDDLADFDVIVRTAGLHPHSILEKNPSAEDKLTSAIDEFLRICSTKNVIGVTGTKGKGTTSMLIAKMLEAAGRTVHLGGNIGRSPLEFYDAVQPDDWVVLELSSFQLIDLHHSPHIAVCLMAVPEHLNWHTDMAEYTTAKSRLFEYQTSNDIAIYFAGNETSREIAQAGAARKIPYFESPGAWVNGDMVTIDGQEICTTNEIKLLGAHNWQNVCAAITAVWQAGVRDIDSIRRVVTSFAGLEHRLEFVRELDGVRYYDDSFGTTPETAIVALAAFDGPKVVILGGSDKGASYDELAQAVANDNVRKVVLIGEQARPIKEALSAADYTETVEDCQNMVEVVSAAREAAQTSDVVLLSTGCASFGMFTDYKDRGNQFKQAVQALV
jgi:UDP-N-acetylmuramoylalanine--D-glutamate ligase